MIVNGESSNREVSEFRRSLVSIIHNIPITCRYIHSEAKSYESFEYILFYERVRTGISSPYFFLDGVPSGIQLFTGPTSVNLPNQDVKKLKLRDVVSDRLTVVGKLESMPADAERKIELTTLHTAGLPPQVPGPARFLVARTRAIFRGLRATKKKEIFHYCDNANCCRMFYAGELAETWSSNEVQQVVVGEDDEEPGSSDEYWQLVGGQYVDNTPDTRRFCCRACRQQHSEHLASMMPDCNIHLDADDYAKKQGRARVGESFKMALKRNESAARALRTMRSKKRTNLAVSELEIERHLQNRITALNIDLGLLYAASILSESGNMSSGKILPGQRLYWRDESMYYSKALQVVIRIYKNMKRKEGIISSMLTIPKFLEHVSAHAYKMF